MTIAAIGNWDMTDDEFWSIIESAAVDGDCRALAAAVEAALSSLPAAEIIAFDEIRKAKLRETYRWDLWGVAFVINGGCSDDGFEDFCHWLMTLGRRGYGQILQDPEAVIEFAPLHTTDRLQCEELMYAATNAYAALTGDDHIPESVVGRDQRWPIGDRWDEDTVDLLLPRVAAWVNRRGT